MKKLILFLTLLFVGFGANFDAVAQYSPSNNLNYIKLLKVPPTGSVEDSVMVFDGSDSFVKMRPSSELITKATPTKSGVVKTNSLDADPVVYTTTNVDTLINKKINLPTGFLQGLQLSINADPTKFDIAPGYYVVTDFTNLANPVVKIITYAGATGLTPAYLASANSTYVALGINGNVVSSASPFTNADRRTLAIIGNVVHSNNTTINVTNEIKAPIVASTNQVHDFMRAIGFLNEEGNIYSPNGANLQINKSAGKIFGMGINSADYLNPHQLSMPAQTALTFAYRLRGGTQYANTTSIDPNNWDNDGVLTSVPVGNRWTIQRINLFQSGLTRIQYGQTVYTSYNDAVTALPTQSFVTEQNIADNAVFRCYLIVQQGTTNLASAVAAGTALFVPVDKFGNVIGNGSVALTYANIVAALGYTPENVANKTDSYTTSSSTAYVSGKALVEGLGTKLTGTNSSEFYRNIYYMGDSLTDDGIYIYTISSLLGNSWTNFNFGRSGELTSNMLARFTADVLSKKNPSHVVILGGTNDVTNLVPASTIQANLQAMYTAAKNAGIKVIAVTITPRTTTATQLAIQQAVNTWITTTAIDIDYVVDPYATLADPSNPTQLLPAYTYDGLHMTVSGYTTLGNYIYSNTTWEAKENTLNLKMDVKGYAASNQELYTYSDAVFKTINTIAVGTGSGNVYTNTSIGRKSLNSNTYGKYNTALGNESLFLNTTGTNLVGIGHSSLSKNTTGFGNTSIGSGSMENNTTGYNNVAIGVQSLYSNTTGTDNIGIGNNALRSASVGLNLIAIGSNSLLSNSTGTNLIAIGSNALQQNSSGVNSIAIGTNALSSNVNGSNNVGIGLLSLSSNTGGYNNTAINLGALNSNVNGFSNIGIGTQSLSGLSSGNSNVGIGVSSGSYLSDLSTPLTTSNNSIFIGDNSRANSNNTDNEIVVGANTTGAGSNSVTLGNPSIASTILRGVVTAGTSIASPSLTGTPTAPTAAVGTNTPQIATMEALQAAKAIDVRKISTNTTLSDSDNGKVILITASCTVTLPNGLMSGFNVSFATQAGATLAYSLGSSVVLINNAGTSMGELSSHTIVNTGVANEYLTVGL